MAGIFPLESCHMSHRLQGVISLWCKLRLSKFFWGKKGLELDWAANSLDRYKL